MATNYPIKGDADKKLGANFAPLSVSAQDVPNLTVKIRAGAFFNSQNELVEFAGGNSATLTLPTSGTRWSIVGLSDAGAIAVVNGVQGASPSVPTLPAGVLPLAAIYLATNTVSVTSALIHDIRPFARSIDNVPNLSTELANRPTFTDFNNALLTKADNDGTPDATFSLNKDFLVGTPNDDVLLSVKRGGSPDVSIRWNESLDVWEFTNDGSTFSALLSTTGTFAPLTHTHVASDVTNFNTAVDTRIASAVVPQSQVTNLTSDLASKATTVALTSHTSDASIHFTLPIAQSSVTNLVSDLANKVDIAAPGAIGTTSGVLTVQATGNQPIALNSSDTGSSGLLVDRTAAGFPAVPARLEWDESTDAWLIGVTGAMDTVLTDAVIASKADKVVGAINGHIASLDAFGNLLDSGVVATNVVINTRAINTSTGLSGGGDLSADRTISLANTAVTAASYGSATSVPIFTVDAQGRLTAAADVTIAIPQSAVTNLTTDLGNKQPLDADLTAIAALAGNTGLLHTNGAGIWTVDVTTYTPTSRLVSTGTGLSGGGDLSADRTISLANTLVTAAAYGSASVVPTFTVDAQGRLTAAADVSIVIAQAAVTNLTTDLAAKLDDVPTAVDGNIVSWASTGTVLADSGISVAGLQTVYYEFFVATAGQTIFNIANFTNVVGSHRLQVFVNGIKQVEPGNGGSSAYSETTNSITFVSGLVVGNTVELYFR